ncbi:MAG TPA: amino acid ABC transporter ATP-binding protein [bacterium]|nr:amino acid ABC transporter ATP-binding protein [bacterium]
MGPILRIVDLHKRFGSLEVLRGVSLDVAQGEVVTLIGASGSGKTTLLRCINALEEYQEGRIYLGDTLLGYRENSERLARLPESQLARQRADVGMVFQSFNLFPHITVLDNVALGLVYVRRRPGDEARRIAASWLERVGLADKVGAYPFQLSGGQQQRVAIARAVAMGPKLLLFDEVTSALDPELVGEVLSVMQDLARSGHTMLVVSHEMMFVREVAHRVIFMDGGVVAEQGPPDQLLHQPRTERLRTFLGRFRGVFGAV